MGFFNSSEILPGLAFVGSPPAPYAAWTFYEAGVLAKAGDADAARAFARALADAGAAGKWTAAALEPAGAYRR
jgi:hypothetical protein